MLQVDDFRTLKIASRLFPMLIVWRSVPTKTRFRPVTAAIRHLVPLVMCFPFRGFLPLIVIFGAMIKSAEL